jgi:hypothetical protein
MRCCQAYDRRAKASMIIDETLITKTGCMYKTHTSPTYLCTQIFLLANTFLPQSRAIVNNSKYKTCYVNNSKPKLTYLLTYLQFSVIKWAKQRPGQRPN